MEKIELSFDADIAAISWNCETTLLRRRVPDFRVQCCKDRPSLSPDALPEYLHILINMPDLSEFNYYPAVEAWFEEKKRRPSENVPVTGAEWYRGVFPRPNK